MSTFLEQPWLLQIRAFLEQHWSARFLALVAAAVVGAKLADWIVSRLIMRLARKTRTDVDNQLVALLHRPVFLTVLLAGLWLALLQVDQLAGTQVFFRRVLTTVMILVWMGFTLRAGSVLLEALSRVQDRVGFVEPRTLPLIDNTVKIVAVGAAVYFLFLTWGIDVAAWLAAAGVVGIAVGFAAKDTLANLFSGIFILADAPYKVGDFIVLDSGERGRVTQVGLRSTRLLTRDDVEVTLPNAVIGNAKIMNESGGPWEKHRVRVKVGVAYGSDVDRVREVLMEIATTIPEVVQDPAPRVRFRAFGDSSLDHELLCWIAEPVLRGRVLDALNCAVYKRFREEGIEIPFPQQDVHVRQMPSSES